MAIVTADIWSAWSNVYPTGNELVSLNRICAMVDAAVKTRLSRTIEEASYTIVMDAPTVQQIDLSRYAPISTTGLSVYLNTQAHGDPDEFDSTNLLTNYSDYQLKGEDGGEDPTFGLRYLYRTTGWWGIQQYRPPHSLALQKQSNVGSVKLVFTGGYAAGSIPEDIVSGACLIVSMALGNRKTGQQIGTESWGGYNYNSPGVGLLSQGLMGNPDVASFLNRYRNYEAELA